MPSRSIPLNDPLRAKLITVGERLRAHRKHLGIRAITAAEATRMSRVTLHRIEKGEPSVTMGAYLSLISALGLELELVNPKEHKGQAARALPSRIPLAAYPQLARLAWQRGSEVDVTPKQALDLYERNWRHVDQNALNAQERNLVKQLVEAFGGGRLLV